MKNNRIQKFAGYLFIHMQEKCRQSEMSHFMQKKGETLAIVGESGMWKVGHIKSCDGADRTTTG